MSARTDLCGGYRATDIPTAILGGPRMVNDGSRRSHDFQDELRGKPKWVGVHVSERLSSTYLGKTSRGKPRPKPESGNPTFRECVQQKLVCSRRRQHGASQNWPTRRDTLAGLERQH